MNTNHTHQLEQLQAEREAAARECQALIGRGEELLDRAHQVADMLKGRVWWTIVRSAVGDSTESAPGGVPRVGGVRG
jgi:hypothetical protein